MENLRPSLQSQNLETRYAVQEMINRLIFLSSTLNHQVLSQQMDELTTNLRTYLEDGNV